MRNARCPAETDGNNHSIGTGRIRRMRKRERGSGGAEDRIERKFCGQRWGEFLRYKFRTYLTLMFVYAAEIE